MEDVVAVCIQLDTGEKRYVLTWGRIQDPIDPVPLETLVLQHSHRLSLGGAPMSARVCLTLQEAAQEPYFYECLLEFGQRKIPYGPKYKVWRKTKEQKMAKGKELCYLGRPIGERPDVPPGTGPVIE